MKNIIVILLALLAFNFSDNNIQTKKFTCAEFTAIYQTENGMLHGEYNSFYTNGKKKATGYFDYGTRVGAWLTWDKNRKLTQRYYKNMFTVRVSSDDEEFEASQMQPIPNLSEFEYNANGYINYFAVNEKMIVYAKRYWRNIPIEDNQIIEKYSLSKIISDAIKYNKIKVYSGDYKDFKTIKAPEFNQKQIAGYSIIEDYFYDTIRKISEKRIISISPYIKTKDGVINRIFWIYFTDLRIEMAKIKFEESNLPQKIKTMDDLFFHRYFSSIIYKQENLNNTKLTDFTKEDDIDKEAENMEIQLIELEHEFWLKY